MRVMKGLCLAILAGLLGCAPAPGSYDGVASLEKARQVGGVAWEGCPAPPASLVGDGELWLQVPRGLVLCAKPDLAITPVEAELERKAKVQLLPGDYFLPLEEGAYDLLLSACTRLPRGRLGGSSSEGQLEVTREEVLGRERVELRLTQPVIDDRGLAWILALSLGAYLDQLEGGVVLDERALFEQGLGTVLLCRGESCEETEDLRVLGRCDVGDLPRSQHTFRFEDGSLRVTARATLAGSRFEGQIEIASGDLFGVGFSQTGYWGLVVRPTYGWDTARDYVVRLPTAIGSVCGVVIRQAYPYDSAYGAEAAVLRCDGEVEPRTLYDEKYEELPELSGEN